jgi:xylulokinase
MMLGTGGNLLIPKTKSYDTRLINTIHLTGESLSLGGVLAGGSVQWFREMLGIDDPNLLASLEGEAAQVPPGAEGLIFLPYLMGERTPIWDARARGVFIGLSSTHKRGHLFRAVLEGVAFAYQQMMDVSVEMGSQIKEIIAINGGARSALWRQIFADVLGVPIRWRPSSEGTSLGAAFLTALGVGDFSEFGEINAWLEPTINTYPDEANADIYRNRYNVYSQLYTNLRDIFVELNS